MSAATTSPLEAQRAALVLAALEHVPFDGWSSTALRHAAADCGLDAGAADRAFPHGVIDAVEEFTRLADRLMGEDVAALDLSAIPVPARLGTVIRTRLTRWEPHKESVRRALSVYALPLYLPRATKATWKTVDAIWRAAGDRSNDYNWYTKRASLLPVYSATILYWLDDPSEDSAETWAFLEQRLQAVARAVKARKALTDKVMRSCEGLVGRNPLEAVTTLFGKGAKRRKAF